MNPFWAGVGTLWPRFRRWCLGRPAPAAVGGHRLCAWCGEPHEQGEVCEQTEALLTADRAGAGQKATDDLESVAIARYRFHRPRRRR